MNLLVHTRVPLTYGDIFFANYLNPTIKTQKVFFIQTTKWTNLYHGQLWPEGVGIYIYIYQANPWYNYYKILHGFNNVS